MASKSKKGLAAMLIVGTAITAAGCAETPIITGEEGELQITQQITQSSAVQPNEPERKDAPYRVAPGLMMASYEAIKLEEWLAKADMIVDLTIVEWLDESLSRDDLATYYTAKINQTFMGEKVDTIILRQDGNTQKTFVDIPLFKNGDRLLMVLKKHGKEDYERGKKEGAVYDVEYETFFGGSRPLTFVVCENDDELFLLRRHHMNFYDRFDDNKNIKKADEKTLEKIVTEFLKNDADYSALFEGVEEFKGVNIAGRGEEAIGDMFEQAFDYDDVVRMLTEIAKEVNENE